MSLDGKSQRIMKCKTINVEENGMSKMLKSRNIQHAWDDYNPEIKCRKYNHLSKFLTFIY